MSAATLRAADSRPGATAATSSTAAATAGAPKYLLQYKFHAGEEIRWLTKQVATVETTISGSTQKTDMGSQSTKLWRLTTVEPSGTMTFEHSIENVEMRNQMSGRAEVRYNSQTDAVAPPGFGDVAKSVGKTLSSVTIDPSGAVLKREEKQLHSITDSSGSVMVIPLPKEPVAIGKVWSLPIDVNVNLADQEVGKAIKTRQRLELLKVENGVATIGVETQVLTPIDDPKIQVQLIQRLSKGELRFDIAAGRIVSYSTDLDQRVLGFSGPDSVMHYVAHFSEELITQSPAKDANKTAAK